MLSLVVVVIGIALIFDFLNGFHDSANSIATVVSTRVLTPRKAVMWAAFFNLVAAFLFDVHVAKTLGKGLVDLAVVNEFVIMSGLMWIYHDRPSAKINPFFRTLPLFSAALYSLGHGTNDAQTTMRVI